MRRLTRNNPNLYLIKVNAHPKFDQRPSIRLQDIVWERNFEISNGT